MVSSIEVTKAVTPDMDGNAVGGAINVNTLTAFDRSGAFLFGSLSGLQHQQTVDFGDNNLPYQANVTAGTQLGSNNQWGVVVSGSASRRDYKASVVNPGAWIDVDGDILPEELERETQDTQRERYGISANIDFRPTETTSLYLRSYYSQTEEFDNTAEYQFALTGDYTPLSATSGRFSEGEGALDADFTQVDEYLVATTLGGEQQFGNVTLLAQGTYTRGYLERNTDKPDFASTFDASGDFVGLNYENASAVTNPALYLLDEVDVEFESNTEDTWVGSADLRWDTQFGNVSSFFKTGFKVRTREKVIDDLEFGYVGGTNPRTMADNAMPAPSDLQGGASMPVLSNTGAFIDFFEREQDNPEFFELDNPESQVEGVENDSNNGEDVYAGYLMGNAELGALTVTGGLRVEATETRSQRWELFINDDTGEQTVEPATFSNGYVNLLPSLHLKYAPTDNVVLRGSWSNTIGRPDYEELSGFREFEFAEVEPEVYEGGVEEGNPDLKPFKAMSFDATAEYYSSSGGLFSVGGFYKRIADPIYEFEVTERDITFEGLFFEDIEFQQDRNADAGTVRGLQQLLLFLPGPLSGLGISSNVALIDSEVDVPGREDGSLPFFGQSDLVYNVIPYYQQAGFELRMALSFQSEYLDSVGGEAFEDEYGDDRLTIDLTGSYAFWNDQLELKAQVRNLTNEAERAYQGTQDRSIQHILTGRTFTLGVAASF